MKVASVLLGCALSLACLTLAAQEPDQPAADPPEVFDPLIDPRLRWRLEAVPDEKNAAPLIRKLRELRKPTQSDLEFSKVQFVVERQRRSWKPGEELELLTAYVERTKPLIELIDQAAARGAWYSQDRKEISSLPGDLGIPRQALKSRIEWLASKGDFAAAAAQMEVALRFYELGMPIEPGMIRLLQSAMLQSAQELSEVHPQQAELLRPVLARADALSAAAPDRVMRLRSVFRIYVTEGMGRLPAGTDAEKALDAVCGGQRTSLDAINAQLSKRDEQIRSLLKGHPALWDREATVRLANEIFVEAIDNPRSVRGKTLFDRTRQEVEAWPPVLSLRIIDSIRLFLMHEQPELDDKAIADARKKLAMVKNVLGKHLVTEADPYASLSADLTSFANFEARKTVLAIRVFRIEQGRLPKSLDELVEAKLLSRVPSDPFGDRILYSPEKAIVWSVGHDGRDDGGARGSGAGFKTLFDVLRPAGAKEAKPVEGPSGPVDMVFDIDRPPPAKP